MTPPPALCRRIRSLFRLISSSNSNEAARAREKLIELLAKHGISWNDVPACVALADDDDRVKILPRGKVGHSTTHTINALKQSSRAEALRRVDL